MACNAIEWICLVICAIVVSVNSSVHKGAVKLIVDQQCWTDSECLNKLRFDWRTNPGIHVLLQFGPEVLTDEKLQEHLSDVLWLNDNYATVVEFQNSVEFAKLQNISKYLDTVEDKQNVFLLDSSMALERGRIIAEELDITRNMMATFLSHHHRHSKLANKLPTHLMHQHHAEDVMKYIEAVKPFVDIVQIQGTGNDDSLLTLDNVLKKLEGSSVIVEMDIDHIIRTALWSSIQQKLVQHKNLTLVLHLKTFEDVDNSSLRQNLFSYLEKYKTYHHPEPGTYQTNHIQRNVARIKRLEPKVDISKLEWKAEGPKSDPISSQHVSKLKSMLSNLKPKKPFPFLLGEKKQTPKKHLENLLGNLLSKKGSASSSLGAKEKLSLKLSNNLIRREASCESPSESVLAKTSIFSHKSNLKNEEDHKIKSKKDIFISRENPKFPTKDVKAEVSKSPDVDEDNYDWVADHLDVDDNKFLGLNWNEDEDQPDKGKNAKHKSHEEKKLSRHESSDEKQNEKQNSSEEKKHSRHQFSEEKKKEKHNSSEEKKTHRSSEEKKIEKSKSSEQKRKEKHNSSEENKKSKHISSEEKKKNKKKSSEEKLLMNNWLVPFNYDETENKGNGLLEKLKSSKEKHVLKLKPSNDKSSKPKKSSEEENRSSSEEKRRLKGKSSMEKKRSSEEKKKAKRKSEGGKSMDSSFKRKRSSLEKNLFRKRPLRRVETKKPFKNDLVQWHTTGMKPKYQPPLHTYNRFQSKNNFQPLPPVYIPSSRSVEMRNIFNEDDISDSALRDEMSEVYQIINYTSKEYVEDEDLRRKRSIEIQTNDNPNKIKNIFKELTGFYPRILNRANLQSKMPPKKCKFLNPNNKNVECLLARNRGNRLVKKRGRRSLVEDAAKKFSLLTNEIQPSKNIKMDQVLGKIKEDTHTETVFESFMKLFATIGQSIQSLFIVE